MFKNASITDVIAKNLKNTVTKEYNDYWSNPYNVARELVQIYNGEPIKKHHITALWKQTGPQDFATRMVFCPDYGSIQSHYHQIVIQINQAVNRAKTQGQEPTNPVIEWYFNNSLAPQEDNSDTSEKQEIKVLFVKKPTQYAL